MNSLRYNILYLEPKIRESRQLGGVGMVLVLGIRLANVRSTLEYTLDFGPDPRSYFRDYPAIASSDVLSVRSIHVLIRLPVHAKGSEG